MPHYMPTFSVYQIREYNILRRLKGNGKVPNSTRAVEILKPGTSGRDLSCSFWLLDRSGSSKNNETPSQFAALIALRNHT